MNRATSQRIILITTRHALIVTLICYLPHFATAPWWLFLLVLSAIGYRLIADYFGYPLLKRWIRVCLVIFCLFLLKIQYGSIITSGYFIGFLLTFIGLKIIEIHTIRDIKFLILCNFYLIFSALIVIQELWIIVYMIIAILANLSLMLKLNAPQASLRQLSSKSIKQLLIAIPLSIILFYIFPRIANPLWHVPSSSQNKTGFSERMNPGSIVDLFNDDSTALRITFKNKPLLNGYWHGLILNFYNGVSWSPGWYSSVNFVSLPELNTSSPADYEVVLEPHQKKWLFYSENPVASRPYLLFSPNQGLISKDKEIINQRFSYSLKTGNSGYLALTKRQSIQNTQLPQYLNPRIRGWAEEQFALVHQNPRLFIQFLQNYLNQQPYWYTLSPPAISSEKNQMDAFWFNTQKGFCEHYASAVAVILRSVGIPARIIIGYQGGEWNPIAQYLTIRQNDAHAWVEYWQEGTGWQQFDPTSYIAKERVDQSILDMQYNQTSQYDMNSTSGLSWLTRSRLFLESARFFAERWLLFYNQDAQVELLKKAGIVNWNMGNLLQAAIFCLVLFIIIFGFYYQWKQRKLHDPLLIEYHLLQKEFRRFNIQTPYSATLEQQCNALSTKVNGMTSYISLFLKHYERLRLQQTRIHSNENQKETLRLFRNFRKKLNKIR